MTGSLSSRARRRVSALAALTLVAGLGLMACADQPGPTETGLTAEPPSLGQGPGAADGFVEGRVLARFSPGADAASLARGQGAEVRRDLVLGIKVLQVPAGRETAVARALSNNPNVEFAEPDYIRTFGDPAVMPVNDPFVGYKWDLDNDGSIYSSTGDVLATTGSADADMDWREAVEAFAGSGGSARIGIMDTGIRNDHEEFVGRIAVQYDFHDDDPDAEDDDGHGTHVAGIAAARPDNGVGVAGVAFAGSVDFAIAKVCGPIHPPQFGQKYGCASSAIAAGITWAVDQGAAVLNLSLGGGSASSAEQAALAYARSRDVLPFCATGNDNSAVSYPGAFPECVAVGATDWSDNRASYSNFGPEIEISAPGGDNENADGYSYILSSYNGGPDSYAFLAGTSMATPQAAGLGALLHVLGVSDDDAKLSNMKSTADDLGASGWDPYFGEGRINVAAAVAAASGGTTNSPPTASFTYTCTDLACDFDGTGSNDSDGSIASYDWDFGDGATATGSTASHTYAAGGTSTVTLTVADDDGATDSASQDVTVTEHSTGISLSATGYKVRGRHAIDLSWTGAASTDVDIFRDGSLLVTTANDGAYTDSTNNRGGASYTYQVCEAGTSTCSNEVTVTF